MNPGKKEKLAIGDGRRRASGDGGNSRRFAHVLLPDGREARVPAAKDACTYICFATAEGDWPKRASQILLYDVTHLVGGTVLRVKEMRPGFGMGTLRPYRIIDTSIILEQHEGSFGQLQRWLLLSPVVSDDEIEDFSVDDLANGGR